MMEYADFFTQKNNEVSTGIA